MSPCRGRRAEGRAERFLVARGLAPVARNYSCRFGELDLVMSERDLLVVVEVRLRSGGSICSVAESVDAAKQGRIILATRHFLATRPEFLEHPVRFDLVAISGGDGDNTLEWTRDAFRP